MAFELRLSKRTLIEVFHEQTDEISKDISLTTHVHLGYLEL